mgnify:CR=1 FL=1
MAGSGDRFSELYPDQLRLVQYGDAVPEPLAVHPVLRLGDLGGGTVLENGPGKDWETVVIHNAGDRMLSYPHWDPVCCWTCGGDGGPVLSGIERRQGAGDHQDVAR